MKRFHLYILACLGALACKEPLLPKQHAYPFITFPKHEYSDWNRPETPYSFLKPDYGYMQIDTFGTHWYNLIYVPFNATLHLSYKKFSNPLTLDTLILDTRRMAYKHTIKATEINEKVVADSNGRKGMVYELEGETATSFNFYLTDGNSQFFRGALYFNDYTTIDSVGPVVKFMKEDIYKMIKSFEFKSSQAN